MTTILSVASRAALLAAARAAWPREMVGVLGGDDRGGRTTVNGFVPLQNGALRGDRFAVEPPEFARAVSEFEDAGQSFLGFVHSHPGGAAWPSDLDRRELWRDCLQLIVAIDAAGRTDLAGFRLVRDEVHELAIVDPD